jgi:hypothetical protein
MLRKIRIAFLAAIAGYILVYLGISYYVSSTVSVDSSSNCIGDLACAQANIVRSLQVDVTLYSLIGALVLAGLAWMVVPASKRRAVSGQRAAASTARAAIQNEAPKVAKAVAQQPVAHKGIPCPRCGADNVNANKFCVECGQSMVPIPAAKKQCARCGADNAAANKFCVECGQSMILPPPAKKECAHCGAINEPGYSFCTDCGTSLTSPKIEPETQVAVSSSSISDLPSAT